MSQSSTHRSTYISSDNSPPPNNGAGYYDGNHGNGDGGDQDIDMKSLFLIIWRRRFLILFLVIIGMCGAYYVSSMIKPIYVARSYILIDSQNDLPSELSGIAKTLSLKDSVILSEAQILKSRNFAIDVIRRLDLMHDPEFSGLSSGVDGAGNDDVSGKDRAISSGEIDGLGEYKTGGASIITPIAPGASAVNKVNGEYSRFKTNLHLQAYEHAIYDADLTYAVNRLLDAVRVSIVSGTNVMYVEVQSISPDKAAKIANTYADLYIEERLRLKFDEGARLSNWLDTRLSALKDQVREADRAVVRYRADHNLVTTFRGDATMEQLSQLNAELIQAKGELAAKQAKLDYTSQIRGNQQDFLSIPDVLRSATVESLKLQEIKLLQERSDLQSKYGSKHPSILNINNEIDILRQKIKSEAQNVVNSIQEEVLIAKARVDALETGFESLVRLQGKENAAMVRLRELMIEAETSRAIYDKFLQTYKKSSGQAELQDPEARIISYAAIPLIPAYPNHALFASLSAALMLFFGIALSFLLEKLDDAFKTVTQLERITHFPCYGVIPDIRIRNRNRTVPILWSKTSHYVAETVRNLRASINLRAQLHGDRPKVITVTSSLSGEGKSTLSTWLSVISARSGDRVCIIDCDLRRPTLHRHLPQSNDKTLVDFLTDQASLDEVLTKNDKTGLYTIFAKAVPNSALDFISSKRMQTLVELLRDEFDVVILDAPACLSVSDARILAKYSDQTLYAVAWGQTNRDHVLLGLKQFIDIGYYNVATVFTRVHAKNYAKLGYGKSEYDEA